MARHGCPRIVITDNGREFKNEQMAAWFRSANIEHRFTTPLHPQTNGKVERANRTLKKAIEKAVANRPSLWEAELPRVLLSLRTTLSVNGYTPHYLLYGRDAYLPAASHDINGEPSPQWLEQLSEDRCVAELNIQDSRTRNLSRLNRVKTDQPFVIGDHVMLRAPPDRLTFTSHWDPGYVVTRVRGPVIFIQGPKGKVQSVNQVRLKTEVTGVGQLNPRPKRKIKQRKPQASVVLPLSDTAPGDDDLGHNSRPADAAPARRPGRPRKPVARQGARVETHHHDRRTAKPTSTPDSISSRTRARQPTATVV